MNYVISSNLTITLISLDTGAPAGVRTLMLAFFDSFASTTKSRFSYFINVLVKLYMISIYICNNKNYYFVTIKTVVE